MRLDHLGLTVIRVVAPNRILYSRLFGLLFTFGMGVIALAMWRDFDSGSTFPYQRMMIVYAVIAAVYVPYSVVCVVLESGLVPRVFVWSTRGKESRGYSTRVMTWRSVWVARAVSASLDSPLEVTVKSKPRAGNLPGFKVDVTLRDFDRRVELRVITLDPDGAAEELLAKLRQAGVNVALVTGSGATS